MPPEPPPLPRTSEAVRLEIQSSRESQRALARRFGIDPKTVAKWKRRTTPHDLPPRVEVRSTVLSPAEERIITAFRRHTLLPIDDCLYTLQATIPHLTRSSLHRCFRRYRVNNLSQLTGHPVSRRATPDAALGDFYIDITPASTAEGTRYTFVATDLTSRFAFIRAFSTATESAASAFLVELVEAMPYPVHSILTDDAPPFAQVGDSPAPHMVALCCLERGIAHRRVARDIQAPPPAPGTWAREGQSDTYVAMRQQLAQFSQSHNFGRRLKTLRGLTPFEYICRVWERHPERFTADPQHLHPKSDRG